MAQTLLLLGLLTLGPCLASDARTTVELEAPVPVGWSTFGQASREQLLELSFAVKQRGLYELHEALMRVSSPDSPDYGRHLSNEEVNAMTAPEADHIEAVTSFLRAHGADPHPATPNSDVIVATVPVHLAEQMLSTSYVKLVHSSGAELTRAPSGYSLPPNVAAAVDFVAPTVHVPGVHHPKPENSSIAAGLGFNTPKNLRSLYNVGDAEGKASANKMAVTAFLEQGYGEGSLKRFWSRFCGGITCGKGEPKLVGEPRCRIDVGHRDDHRRSWQC